MNMIWWQASHTVTFVHNFWFTYSISFNQACWLFSSMLYILCNLRRRYSTLRVCYRHSFPTHFCRCSAPVQGWVLIFTGAPAQLSTLSLVISFSRKHGTVNRSRIKVSPVRYSKCLKSFYSCSNTHRASSSKLLHIKKYLYLPCTSNLTKIPNSKHWSTVCTVL